jgi:hypothetical protein
MFVVVDYKQHFIYLKIVALYCIKNYFNKSSIFFEDASFYDPILSDDSFAPTHDFWTNRPISTKVGCPKLVISNFL